MDRPPMLSKELPIVETVEIYGVCERKLLSAALFIVGDEIMQNEQ